MGRDRRRTWAIGAVVAVLTLVSWWLLARGTRGAEIANVLALPLAVITTVVGSLALPERNRVARAQLEDSGGRHLLLVRAKQKITDQLGVSVLAKSSRNNLELEPPDTRSAHIALRFERKPDAVTYSNKPVSKERSLSPDEDETCLRQTLANSHGLLVLGAAGSGKTTVLFELAQDLITAPDEHHDQSAPVTIKRIPVVLNLSTWGEELESREDDLDDGNDGTIRIPNTDLKFEDWMISALNIQYNMPSNLGRLLVDNEQLIPLFDGLDEVNDRNRDMCVRAMNRFARNHLVDIVVSCRSEEYEKIPTRISFGGSRDDQTPDARAGSRLSHGSSSAGCSAGR